MKYILLSGGFDPLHYGHVRMIQEAAIFGQVIVAVNSDEWLIRKKGYVFMPLQERMNILWHIIGVYSVVRASDDDDSVCETIKLLKPEIFGNGGDRKSDNVPEVALCEELGIKLAWNLGGEKSQSSSELVKNAQDKQESLSKHNKGL